jgi:two-component system, NtrC family, response regulator HydG
MKELFETVRKVADAECSVVIEGESGVGKTTIAKTIHQTSSRAHGPLLFGFCGGLAESLAEPELFGYDKGVVAREIHVGLIERANGGTLALGGLESLCNTAQARLLKFLQTGEFQRIGSNQVHRSDVWLLATTPSPLLDFVNKGALREDLYYRLSVINLKVPPLRERMADLPLLAAAFLKDATTDYHRRVMDFEAEALETMANHSWPGNLSELQNVVRRAVLMCESDRIQCGDLPFPTEFQKAAALAAPANLSTKRINFFE